MVGGRRLVADPDRRPSVAAVLAIFPISTGYQILGLLHILAVIVAFGPLFFYPSLQRAGAGADARQAPPAAGRCRRSTLSWVLGMGLVGDVRRRRSRCRRRGSCWRSSAGST